MQKIVRAKENHVEALLKCYRRCNDQNPLIKDQESLCKMVEDGNVFILIDGGRVFAFAVVTRDLRTGIFGALPHRSSDYYDLLDELGEMDENVIAVPSFAVDPAVSFQAYAKELFDFLSATYHKPLMLIRTEKNISNEKAAFLSRYHAVLYRGQVNLEGSLFIKKFEVDGLARGFAW